MVHGIEPLFFFDLAEATFLVPPPDTKPLFSSGLIAWRACQLQKCVLKAQFKSVKHFKAAFKNWIKNYGFQAGSLVLVRNTRIEKELNQRTKPQYLGPMVVLRWTTSRSYLLAELDGVVSRLCYAAFQLIPYYSHLLSVIRITELTDMDDENLDKLEEKMWKSPVKKTETPMSQTSPGIRHQRPTLIIFPHTIISVPPRD